MTLRNRLVLVVVGALTLAGLVIMIPSGGQASPAGRKVGHAALDPSATRCRDAALLLAQQAQILAAGQDSLPAGDRATYAELSAKLLQDACDDDKTCADLGADVAAMRSFRQGKLSGTTEAELTAAEDSFLQKYCGS